MNELPYNDHVVLPLLSRTRVSAAANNLRFDFSGWDNDLWAIASWYRE